MSKEMKVAGRAIEAPFTELAAYGRRYNGTVARYQLRYVWPTPVDQRRVGLTGRLDGVQNALGDPKWKTYQPAHALKDQITTFSGEAADHRALLVAGGVASGEIAP